MATVTTTSCLYSKFTTSESSYYFLQTQNFPDADHDLIDPIRLPLRHRLALNIEKYHLQSLLPWEMKAWHDILGQIGQNKSFVRAKDLIIDF
jgi:hypothetical protein